MARRKATADLLRTFLAKPGATRSQAARALNRSVSTVSRVLAGKSSGAGLRAGAAELTRRKPAPDIHLRQAPPPAPAARVAAERAAPVPVALAPGVERVYLGQGRRATILQGVPDQVAMRAELQGVTMHQAQIRVTFADGKTITLFSHGGYDPVKLRRLLSQPNWLEGYMGNLGYKPGQHGGIVSTQVVLL